MHSKATCSLCGLFERLEKLCRRQAFGDCEMAGSLAAMGLLFREEWPHNGGCLRMTDVSRRLMISKPAATQAVARMVDHGLLERVSDENDRRVVYIRPTESGKRLFESELEKKLALTDRVVARMGEENANALVERLNQFFDALAAETEEK